MRARATNRLLLTGAAVIAILAQPAPRAAQDATDGASAAGVSVSGTIINPHPERAPGWPTQMVMTGPGLGPPLFAGVRSDHTFEFQHIKPGTYRISMNRAPMFTEINVDVGTADLRGLKVPVEPGVRVSLAIHLDDGSPCPGGVMLRVIRGHESLMAAMRPGGTGFTFSPGPLALLIRPPAGLFLVLMRAGDTDLLRQPLNVSSTTPAVTVDVELTRTPTHFVGTLSGTLTGDHGGTEVDLVDTTVFGATTDLRSTTAAADGTFAFKGVPPGAYRIDIPPAFNVMSDVVVLAGTNSVTVPIGPGVVFSGGPIAVVDSSGRSVPSGLGRASIVFTSGSFTKSVALVNYGIWGTLPPGAYDVSIRDLPPELSIRSLTAGSVNLRQDRFIVPSSRPPERIRIVLQTGSAAGRP